MATYSVILFKGKDKRDEILPAKSKEEANQKAMKKNPGYIADSSLTAKIG